MSARASKDLGDFRNPRPERDYTIRIRLPEFTCLCPKPDNRTSRPCIWSTCRMPGVELKSLKLYIWSFRDGAHSRAVTNRILDDLVAATSPFHAADCRVQHARWRLYQRDRRAPRR